MNTKTQTAKSLLEAGDLKGCLKLVKDFRIGIAPQDRKALSLGYEALVRLPLTILGKFEDVFLAMQDVEPSADTSKPPRIGNSIDNLKATDPFISASSALPMAPGLKYHSVIARRKADMPLEASDDGLVPYWSAHLDGADRKSVV